MKNIRRFFELLLAVEMCSATNDCHSIEGERGKIDNLVFITHSIHKAKLGCTKYF